MQQITSGFVVPENKLPTVIDTAKRDALSSILQDLNESHIVIFCKFRKDIDEVRAVAVEQKIYVWEISGQIKQLDEWKENGGILVAQIQSGSLGIDLTLARTAIYYSLGFSLGDYLQSRARIRRPGQTKNCNYIHIVAEKTIDPIVIKALKNKQEVVDAIVGRKH